MARITREHEEEEEGEKGSRKNLLNFSKHFNNIT
jgi:hypothetical protein